MMWNAYTLDFVELIKKGYKTLDSSFSLVSIGLFAIR